MAEGHSEAQASMDPSLQSSERDRHSKKPTWKVRENLESLKQELSSDILKLWETLLSHVSNIQQSLSSLHVSPLEGALQQLRATYEHYNIKVQEIRRLSRRH
ncbi:hypothetical protein GDO78_009561 [Eleutherodactylus coqui]|uniref:Uncharacterized protein n=1 Tax=Eleutherodactylus coqui TaxID=57060 RepID=A0A8J6F9U1_ELECQ|nr:hypothetical protein GDO78_009561 [Eleutherodactylus coqui]